VRKHKESGPIPTGSGKYRCEDIIKKYLNEMSPKVYAGFFESG
jgi:hypothetical protein